MATVLDLVNAALSEIGVRAAGETLSASDSADALAALNRLVDGWATENLTIYTIGRTTWTIAASDGEYTVGTGANVNVARPVFIDRVNFIETSTDPDTEYPLKRLTEAGYAGISQKAATSKYPTSWYWNPTMATGTLSLFPVPTASTLTGVLYAPAAVPQFASLSTTVTLPPGYERAIVKNLALELLPSYGRQMDPLLLQQATSAKANVKRANFRTNYLSFEAGALIGGGGSSFDIQLGE